MRWWKKALLASGIWTALIVIAMWLLMERVQREAVSEDHRAAWERKVGEAAGSFFGLGLVAIWGVSWKWQKPHAAPGGG
jgi:hypothetical protein